MAFFVTRLWRLPGTTIPPGTPYLCRLICRERHARRLTDLSCRRLLDEFTRTMPPPQYFLRVFRPTPVPLFFSQSGRSQTE